MGNQPSGFCCSQKQNILSTKIDMQNLIFQNIDFNKAETYRKLQAVAKQFVKTENLSEQQVPLITRIIANKQQHLIQAYRKLKTNQQKKKFIKNLQFLDLEAVDSLFHNVVHRGRRSVTQYVAKPCNYLDMETISYQKKKSFFNKGLKAISQNNVGLLLLCGGADNRFKSTTPKFLLQTNLGSKKCIMELLFMRLKKIVYKANQQANRWNVHIFIMCNQQNYNKIKTFLKKNIYFNIPENFFHYFLQNTIPILNKKGELCLDHNMKIIQSPSGSGEFLSAIVQNKIKSKMINQLQIKYLYVSGLQNILQRPCDPILIGTMIMQNAQVIAKCADLYNVQQEFYRYLQVNGKIKAIHPSKLSDYIEYDEKKLKKSPIFMNSMIFDTDYINKLLMNPQVRYEIARTFHVQQRQYSYLNVKQKNKEIIQGQMCYVFEKQLSDLFLASQKTILMKIYRQQQFCPIITKDGQWSIRNGQKALIRLHEKIRKQDDFDRYIFDGAQILENNG